MCVKPSAARIRPERSAYAGIPCLLFRGRRGGLSVYAELACAVIVQGNGYDLTRKNRGSSVLVLRCADTRYVTLDLAVQVDLAAGLDTLNGVHADHVRYS